MSNILKELIKMDEYLNSSEFKNMVEKEESEVELKWGNKDVFETFMNELESYLLNNERISSDAFSYNIEKNPFSVGHDYCKYIECFVNTIISYCDKYCIPLINTNIEDSLEFNELCLLLEYNNFCYKIERISGQGTFDIIIKYKSKEECVGKYFYIKYDDLIKNAQPNDLENIIKHNMIELIDNFKKQYKKELDIIGFDIALLKKEDC